MFTKTSIFNQTGKGLVIGRKKRRRGNLKRFIQKKDQTETQGKRGRQRYEREKGGET